MCTLHMHAHVCTCTQQDGAEEPTSQGGRCEERSILCDVQHFLDFLTSLFDHGLQHRTIIVIRSSVSMTLEQSEGVCVCRFYV